MAEFRIERDVVIEAPVDVVWRTITEPDQITRWFADRVELELKPGGEGYLGFGDQGGPVVVETVDPLSRFTFRWNFPIGEKPVPGNSVLVEFILTARGPESTRLQVVESGDGSLAWSETEKERYTQEHSGGWDRIVGRLTGLFAGPGMG